MTEVEPVGTSFGSYAVACLTVGLDDEAEASAILDLLVLPLIEDAELTAGWACETA